MAASSQLALQLMFRITPRPVPPIRDKTSFDWIVQNIFDNTLVFFGIPHHVIITFVMPKSSFSIEYFVCFVGCIPFQ